MYPEKSTRSISRSAVTDRKLLKAETNIGGHHGDSRAVQEFVNEFDMKELEPFKEQGKKKEGNRRRSENPMNAR